MIVLALLLAMGEEYLTREAALRLVLPEARQVQERRIELEEATRKRVAERYGSLVDSRQTVYVGMGEDGVTGYAMILTEVTKTMAATFIVGIRPDGRVSEVAVMSHEDHIGTDCRRARFVDQFRGKSVENRLVVPNGGILPVSGATLSCQAVARAVRKALAVVQYQILDQASVSVAGAQEEPCRQKRYLMGTFLTITADGPPEAVEKSFDVVRRLEEVLTDYDDKSELSRLNREQEMDVGEDLLEFLQLSRRFSEETKGSFDVTVAPIVRLWGFRSEKHRVPGDEEIRDALRRVGWKKIGIDGKRVRLEDGAQLDPGAIGKGMAVDRAVHVLRQAGVRRALVDFGSSTYALGSWSVAIRDPFDPSKIRGQVTIENEALSTSGSYENFFEVEGRRYPHIVDPHTGRPVEGRALASVITPTATEGDAYSTAIFVSGTLPERHPALLISAKGEDRSNESWNKRAHP